MEEQKPLSSMVNKRTLLSQSLIIASFILFIFLVLILNLLSCSHAEVKRKRFDPAVKANRMIAEMKHRLKLNDDQEKRVRPIIEEIYKQRAEIKQKYRGEGPEEMRSSKNRIQKEMEELRKYAEMRLKMVLTEKQMEEYQKIEKEYSASEKRRSGDSSERRNTMKRGKPFGGLGW